MDYATATIVAIVKFFLTTFNADTNRDNGAVIRSLVALSSVNEDATVHNLTDAIVAWRAGESDYRHPLSPEQFVLAKKLVCKYATTLARLAKNRPAGETATANTPTSIVTHESTPASVTPAPAEKPSALPPRGQKRVKQAKQPRLPKPERILQKTGYTLTPDKDGMPPWEYDDRDAA